MKLDFWLIGGLTVNPVRGISSYLRKILVNEQKIGHSWQLKHVIDQFRTEKLEEKTLRSDAYEKRTEIIRRTESITFFDERVNQTRIIGGVPVSDETSWPFMVKIAGVCGGSLISRQHVLTAGHCCAQSGFKNREFYFGVRRNSDLELGQRRNVRNFIIHGEYNEISHSNDICVVLLNEPVDLNERVQPIGLPRNDEDLFGDDFNGNVFIAGKGSHIKRFQLKWDFIILHSHRNSSCMRVIGKSSLKTWLNLKIFNLYDFRDHC